MNSDICLDIAAHKAERHLEVVLVEKNGLQFGICIGSFINSMWIHTLFLCMQFSHFKI